MHLSKRMRLHQKAVKFLTRHTNRREFCPHKGPYQLDNRDYDFVSRSKLISKSSGFLNKVYEQRRVSESHNSNTTQKKLLLSLSLSTPTSLLLLLVACPPPLHLILFGHAPLHVTALFVWHFGSRGAATKEGRKEGDEVEGKVDKLEVFLFTFL